jgi:hypothetical protein
MDPGRPSSPQASSRIRADHAHVRPAISAADRGGLSCRAFGLRRIVACVSDADRAASLHVNATFRRPAISRFTANLETIHQIVRTGYFRIGSSFVTKPRPSATAWAIRIRSKGSVCSAGSAAKAVT